MIALIDYDAGNIKSAQKAFAAIGEETVVTRNPEQILAADHVVLPGVGAFGDAMNNLVSFGLDDVVRKVVDKKIPLLGICVGLQLLFEDSEETPQVAGIGVLKGHIKKIKSDEKLKIPHMGWNSISKCSDSYLLNNIPDDSYMYFVHSYYLEAADKGIVSAVTHYGVEIHAAVEKDNVFAVQFHPEKSGDMGLRILKNFAQR